MISHTSNEARTARALVKGRRVRTHRRGSGTVGKSASNTKQERVAIVASSPARSKLMARVRQKGTNPELVVRAIVKTLGHEFGINGKELPGSPDLFDRKRRLAVFVHGCFWHRHARCRACTAPKSNAAFWQQKFDQNVARDQKKARQLRRLGFRVMTVWECQVKSASKLARLERRLERFFANAR